MRSASSSSPRAARMSAIWPWSSRARARRRGARRPAAAPRGGCAAPRRARRGPEDVGDLPMVTRAGADVAEALVDRQLLLAADAQRLVELAPGLQDVGDLALVTARERTSPRRSKTGSCSSRRMRSASSSSPRAWRMSAILPWVMARRARRRGARRPAAAPRGGCAAPRRARRAPRGCRRSCPGDALGATSPRRS